MYIKLFHRLSVIIKNFKDRFEALLSYITDYKIIFISILIVLFDIFFLSLLRNKSDEYVIGMTYALFSMFIFSFLLISLLGNICEIANSRKSPEKPCSIFRVQLSALVITVLIASISLMTVSNFSKLESNKVENAASFTNKNPGFWGYVAKEPKENSEDTILKVKFLQDLDIEDAAGSNIGNDEYGDIGLIQVEVPSYPKFQIGQVCKFEGELSIPENYSVFDYKQYLANKNVYTIMKNAKIECLPIERMREGNKIFNGLIDMKNYLIKIIDFNLPEPQSSLLAGIILGQERAFSEKFEEYTRISGVSHIVAASGYNVTILILAVNKGLFFLKKKHRNMLSILAIWSFCIISGLSPSIIRASIMGCIFLLASLLGRSNSIHISLPLASAVFVLLEPTIIYDVGFQLSICATLGLVYIVPCLERIFKKKVFFREYFLTTLACTISTLPISILTFKTISVWSVIANVLVLPVVESTMFWGVLGCLFSKLIYIGRFFFLIAYVQLKYFEIVVSGIGVLNWGYFEISESAGNIVGILLLSLIFLLTIYFYPVKNANYNHYLKNN